MTTLTGNPDTDSLILLKLPYPSLISTCLSSKYLYSLCQSDYFWKQKVNRDFGRTVMESKPQGESYREQYIYLRRAIKKREIEFQAEKGRLDALIVLGQRYNMNLTMIKRVAAVRGHLHILKWLVGLKSPIRPTSGDADEAAWGGHLEVLKWMIQLNPPVFFPKNVVDYTAANGHLHVLKWLLELSPDYLPTKDQSSLPAKYGHLDVLKWMLEVNPDSIGIATAIGAASGGQIEVLNWLAHLNPPVFPDEIGAIIAAENGHLISLQWMADQTPPILPTLRVAQEAYRWGRSEIVRWILQTAERYHLEEILR